MGIARSDYAYIIGKQQKLSVRQKHSKLELEVYGMIKCAELPLPVAEYLFAPPRRFRFDYAWPDDRVALECEGGIWVQGRHNRGQGFINDCEKYNLACVMGWRVLRYTPHNLDLLISDLKALLYL